MIKEVKEALDKIMPKTGYIFRSVRNEEKPMKGQNATKALKDAIEKMGIDRKDRNITFHSFRHGIITHLRGYGLSDAQIRMVTGQKSSRVIDGYTRFNEMYDTEVVKAMESLSSSENLELYNAIEALKILGTPEALKSIEILKANGNTNEVVLPI